MDAYKTQADLIKALAHPARLRILDILAKGESCVCHLTTILRKRQPYVSQHLMTLREADLVLDRRDGTIVYYRLSDDAISEVIEQIRALLGDGLEFPPTPGLPVAGCPCPKCEKAALLARRP